MYLSRAGGALIFAGTLSAVAHAQTPAPLPEQRGSFDYPSVAAALRDLRSRPDVAVSVQQGWTVVEEPSAATLWSFAPEGDPSYPSVVKRALANENGEVRLHMSIKCEASKAACDNLVRQFNDLNAQMINSLHR